MRQVKRTVVVCRPDRYIYVPAYVLQEILKEKMTISDRQRFDEVTQLIMGLAVIELFDIRRRTRKNFNFFSQAAKGQMQMLALETPSKQELDDKEMKFLKDFLNLLIIANFRPLTQQEMDIALEEEFDVRLPIEVIWGTLDHRLLGRLRKELQKEQQQQQQFIEMYGEQEKIGNGIGKVEEKIQPYDDSDRMMIYHRGYGVAKKSGLFINDKLDLLVEYLIYNPAIKLYKKIKGKGEDELQHSKTRRLGDYTLHPTQDKGRQEFTIERKTLRQALPTPGEVLVKFFSQIQIQEPTFQNIVLLYRRRIAKPSEQLLREDANAKRRYQFERRNINIKSFGELAMADLEIIFPDKKLNLKPVAFLQIIFTLAAAIIMAVVSLISGVDMWAAFSILCAAAFRMAQAYSSMQFEKAEMTKIVSEKQYTTGQDSQEGAVFRILDEIGEQHLKEIMVAYAVLLLHKNPMTRDHLDKDCEEFLNTQFNIRVIFDLEETLPKLLEWGLVYENEDGLLMAVCLQEAYDTLTLKWATAFNLDGKMKYSDSQKSLSSVEAAAAAARMQMEERAAVSPSQDSPRDNPSKKNKSIIKRFIPSPFKRNPKNSPYTEIIPDEPEDSEDTAMYLRQAYDLGQASEDKARWKVWKPRRTKQSTD